MPIRDWPQAERPREKLLSHSPATLSDAELLAIFLRTGIPGKSAVDLSRDLLKKFGNLRAIIQSKQKDFCQMRGLGLAKYAQLQAAVEITRRCYQNTIQHKNVLGSPQDTIHFLSASLRHYEHEVFACLFLDTANHVISFEELFHGTINAAAIYAREVVKKALHYNAAAVIFAHNHPSGVAEPSQSDKCITELLKTSLLLIDVRVIDHIVIGDGTFTSFADRGFL